MHDYKFDRFGVKLKIIDVVAFVDLLARLSIEYIVGLSQAQLIKNIYIPRYKQ